MRNERVRVACFTAAVFLLTTMLLAVPADASTTTLHGRWTGTTTVGDYTATDIDHDGVADVWCPGHVTVEGSLRAAYLGNTDFAIEIEVCGSPSTFSLSTSRASITAGATFLFTPPTLLLFPTNPLTVSGRFAGLDPNQTSIIVDITGQYVRCTAPVAPSPGATCPGGTVEDASGAVTGQIVR